MRLSPFSVATQSYYIVAGQHSFLASQRVREQRSRRGHPTPRWALLYRCTVVKADVSVSDVEMVAGRQQAQAANVVSMSMAATMQFLHGLVVKHREETPDVEINRTALLLQAYAKTGKNIHTDGTPVCTGLCLCGDWYTMDMKSGDNRVT